MNEVIKQTIFKLVLPVLVPVAVGLGSAVHRHQDYGRETGYQGITP